MKTLIVGACALGLVACAHTGTAATPQQALLDWHNRYPIALPTTATIKDDAWSMVGIR